MEIARRTNLAYAQQRTWQFNSMDSANLDTVTLMMSLCSSLQLISSLSSSLSSLSGSDVPEAGRARAGARRTARRSSVSATTVIYSLVRRSASVVHCGGGGVVAMLRWSITRAAHFIDRRRPSPRPQSVPPPGRPRFRRRRPPPSTRFGAPTTTKGPSRRTATIWTGGQRPSGRPIPRRSVFRRAPPSEDGRAATWLEWKRQRQDDVRACVRRRTPRPVRRGSCVLITRVIERSIRLNATHHLRLQRQRCAPRQRHSVCFRRILYYKVSGEQCMLMWQADDSYSIHRWELTIRVIARRVCACRLVIGRLVFGILNVFEALQVCSLC